VKNEVNIKTASGRVGSLRERDCYVVTLTDYLNNIGKYNDSYCVIKTGKDNDIYDLVLRNRVYGVVTGNGYITWIDEEKSRVDYISKVRTHFPELFPQKKEEPVLVRETAQEEVSLEELLAIGDKMFKDALKEIDNIVSA
jgi:hypothetical protein